MKKLLIKLLCWLTGSRLIPISEYIDILITRALPLVRDREKYELSGERKHSQVLHHLLNMGASHWDADLAILLAVKKLKGY